MSHLPTWPVAGGSLAVGFAVAQATGVRPLGGLVLVAGAGWCAWRWRASGVPLARVVALLGAYLAFFVASHLIASALTTWGAVAVVSAGMAALAWALADRAAPSLPAAIPAP